MRHTSASPAIPAATDGTAGERKENERKKEREKRKERMQHCLKLLTNETLSSCASQDANRHTHSNSFLSFSPFNKQQLFEMLGGKVETRTKKKKKKNKKVDANKFRQIRLSSSSFLFLFLFCFLLATSVWAQPAEYSQLSVCW